MDKKSDPLKYIRIKVDDESHIKQATSRRCEECTKKPCLYFCPSQVFTWDEENGLGIDYSRCVECGACLRGCPYQNILWDYPRPGFGICHEI